MVGNYHDTVTLRPVQSSFKEDVISSKQSSTREETCSLISICYSPENEVLLQCLPSGLHMKSDSRQAPL